MEEEVEQPEASPQLNDESVKRGKFIKRWWFWLILAIGLLTILFITLGMARNPQNSKQGAESAITNFAQNIKGDSPKKDDLRNVWSRGKCEGEGMVEFGTLPMKPEDFSHYIPYGLVTDAHVTPIDHGYFSPMIFRSSRDMYEVRAIADGTIVQIGTRDKVVGDKNHNQAKAAEYRLDIEHTCDLYSYFDLITSLSPDIKSELDKAGGKNFSGRIPIKEGQVIGRIGGQTLDFAVYNNTLRLNFINPANYEAEAWKIHTDDPFKYFKEPAKSILISKNLRTVEPIAGKIDYDIDGKLIGNWFQEGTNGYKGKNQDRYWDGHLAIVYDYLDPTQIRFSIGNFDGSAQQFGIKGNNPDPATVDKASGLIKYELTSFDYAKSDGSRWDQTKFTQGIISKNGETRGSALLQLLDDRKLKSEVFPGKTSDQVTGFTNNARIYER